MHFIISPYIYIYICYSFEQKSSALQTCSFWGLDASSLGGGGSLWEFFWTPKGRWKPFPTFHVGTSPKNIPINMESLWCFFHQCLFVLLFFDFPCCVRRYWVIFFFCWYETWPACSWLGRYRGPISVLGAPVPGPFILQTAGSSTERCTS